MSHLAKILEESRAMAEYGARYAEYLGTILANLDYTAVAKVVDVLDQVWLDNRTVYVAGNGGSAATASHWAVDLSMGTRVAGVPPLRALSLVEHASLLTAIGNDHGYDDVITRQLEALLRPADVLVAISASGNSPNILRAVDFANTHGGTTVGLTGFDGGRLKALCHLCVHVETPWGEYGPVEDVHLVLDHMVTTFLRARRLGAASGASSAAGTAERDR